MLLFWNVLIGGPNQSHKVTFKELPRIEGKEEDPDILKIGRQHLSQKILRKILKRPIRQNETERTSPSLQTNRPPAKGGRTMEMVQTRSSYFVKMIPIFSLIA